jgi:trehalose 6-phosphate synthase
MVAAPTGLVVVSNRLPFMLSKGDDDRYVTRPGSGGLVTALLPVLRDRGGAWVGWHGSTEHGDDLEQALAEATAESGYRLHAVTLTEEERQNFYFGFSNEVVWPLFHDLQTNCNFNPSYWRSYNEVNRKYAEVVAQTTAEDSFIWVHDYQLMMVGHELRRLGANSRLAFFLHIPFPPLDIYVKLPWRFALLRALLEYDLVGFQTLRDRRNFVQCLRALIPESRITGKGQNLSAHVGERSVRIGTFPISIDTDGFVKLANSPEVARKAAELHAQLPNRQLLLGIDRLDYTKGIPHRLDAFRSALERYPDLHEHVTLIQVVIPSREDIAQYHELKVRIDSMIGEINGKFTRPGGWVPIHYVFRSLEPADLLAFYRAAEIGLVTPLKDGMNLVAKEYCACSIEEDCVLILSEFAGAAAQLQNGALLVNPYDIEGVADAIYHAFTMDIGERRARMRRLRRAIREQDVFRWVDSFLQSAIAKDLSAFPLPADYVPRYDAGYVPY